MAEAPIVHGGSRLRRRLYRLVRATTGLRLSTRLRYLDSSVFGADFEARSDAARRIVPAPLEILEHAPGRTLVTMLAFDHRSIDHLSPHRGLAITLPVRYGGEPHGRFAFAFVVTTEEARWSAVELYGFPSVIANVRTEREHEAWIARVSVDGRHVLTLTVHEQPISPAHERVELLGIRDDRRLMEARLAISGEAARSDLPGGATLALGDHPLADPLRRLEVSGESCAHTLYPHALGALSKPRALGRVPRDAVIAGRGLAPTVLSR